MRLEKSAAVIAVLFASLVLFSATKVRAEECPAGVRSCKVITLTPDEEEALVGKDRILDSAAQARFIDLGPAVSFFKQKIATAPNGTVKEEKKQ